MIKSILPSIGDGAEQPVKDQVQSLLQFADALHVGGRTAARERCLKVRRPSKRPKQGAPANKRPPLKLLPVNTVAEEGEAEEKEQRDSEALIEKKAVWNLKQAEKDMSRGQLRLLNLIKQGLSYTYAGDGQSRTSEDNAAEEQKESEGSEDDEVGSKTPIRAAKIPSLPRMRSSTAPSRSGALTARESRPRTHHSQYLERLDAEEALAVYRHRKKPAEYKLQENLEHFIKGKKAQEPLLDELKQLKKIFAEPVKPHKIHSHLESMRESYLGTTKNPAEAAFAPNEEEGVASGPLEVPPTPKAATDRRVSATTERRSSFDPARELRSDSRGESSVRRESSIRRDAIIHLEGSKETSRSRRHLRHDDNTSMTPRDSVSSVGSTLVVPEVPRNISRKEMPPGEKNEDFGPRRAASPSRPAASREQQVKIQVEDDEMLQKEIEQLEKEEQVQGLRWEKMGQVQEDAGGDWLKGTCSRDASLASLPSYSSEGRAPRYRAERLPRSKLEVQDDEEPFALVMRRATSAARTHARTVDWSSSAWAGNLRYPPIGKALPELPTSACKEAGEMDAKELFIFSAAKQETSIGKGTFEEPVPAPEPDVDELRAVPIAIPAFEASVSAGTVLSKIAEEARELATGAEANQCRFCADRHTQRGWKIWPQEGGGERPDRVGKDQKDRGLQNAL